MKMIRLFFFMLVAVSLVGCSQKNESTDTTSEQAAEETGTRPVTAEKLNLNTATSEEFLTIPGVGDRMVHEFEEYRPYVSIVQFRTEMAKYVDEETIAGYEDHVYVPIDINESDAETVAQILGLNLEGAQQVVAARPFADQAEFVAKVTEVAGGVSAQFARLYLAEE